jgi:hypothetical protein
VTVPRADYTNIAFAVEDGCLVMTAKPRPQAHRRGDGVYRHTCPLESFTEVAHAIEAAGSAGLTREELHDQTGIAWTRINVALVFLDERSIITRAGKRGRLVVPASRSLVEDALTEYHALREKGPAA